MAGRNESRKLFATFLNNLSLAFMVAGLIQPVLAVVNEGRSFLALNLAVTVAFVTTGVILGVLAHRVVRRLED